MRTHHTILSSDFSPSFSGHETFPFRYTWLKKGIDAVREDPEVFTSDQSTTILGVGKNMVRSIRHWCLTAGLIAEDVAGSGRRGYFVPTGFGESIFADDGFDPYLEDTATLWLVHWKVATNAARATTWFWAFNLLNRQDFTKERFFYELFNWTKEAGWTRISENSMRRDIDCFLRTYVPSRLGKGSIIEDTFDCPLTELDIIAGLADGKSYQFHRGPKRSLAREIFTMGLCEFWQRYFPQRNALAFADIAYLPNSPGRVFKLHEDVLVDYLESVEGVTEGAIRYDETAGLRQLYRDRALEPRNVSSTMRQSSLPIREHLLCR